MRRPLLAKLACTLLLAACEPSAPPPPAQPSEPQPVTTLRVPEKTCDGVPHPFASRVRQIRVDVDGQSVHDGPFTLDGSSGVSLELGQAAEAVQVNVELLDDEEKVLARGWLWREPPGEANGELELPVHPVEAVSTPAAPDGSCATLGAPRAGHRATLLEDGRVLITGGIEPRSDGRIWLESVEAVNPKSWSVGLGKPARSFGAEPRAWHGAARLADGRVAIFGGERDGGSGLEVTHSALVYDPMNDEWSVLDRLRTARSRAQVGVDGSGRIVIAGGIGSVDGRLAPLDTYEWFEPEAGIFNDGLGAFSARALGAMEYLAGTAFVLAGGLDGAGARNDALALKFNPAHGFMPEAELPQPLTTPRARMAHAVLGHDWLLAAGGTADPDPFSMHVDASAEISLVAYGALPAPAAPPLPRPVVDACAVAVPPREGEIGRVLVAGGHDGDGTLNDVIWEVARSANDEVAVREAGRLKTARFGHSCSALKDGSVLIAGGFTVADGSAATASLERFLPAGGRPPAP